MPKYQHIIPKAYLSGWKFNDTQVYFCEDKYSLIMEPRNTATILGSNHTYTVDYENSMIILFCKKVRDDFSEKIINELRTKKIFGTIKGKKIDENNIDTEIVDFLININECDFFYTCSPHNPAKSASTRQRIMDIRSYVIEEAFSDMIECNWQDSLNKFLSYFKSFAKIINYFGVKSEGIESIIFMIVTLMLRNPENDPFDIYKKVTDISKKKYGVEKGYFDAQRRAHWLVMLYKSLFKEGNNLFNLIIDKFQNDFQICIFECPKVIGSFITSDNPAFINNNKLLSSNMNGMFCPLNSQFILFVYSRENAQINNIYHKKINSLSELKEINNIIFNKSYKSIVSINSNIGGLI